MERSNSRRQWHCQVSPPLRWEHGHGSGSISNRHSHNSRDTQYRGHNKPRSPEFPHHWIQPRLSRRSKFDRPKWVRTRNHMPGNRRLRPNRSGPQGAPQPLQGLSNRLGPSPAYHPRTHHHQPETPQNPWSPSTPFATFARRGPGWTILPRPRVLATSSRSLRMALGRRSRPRLPGSDFKASKNRDTCRSSRDFDPHFMHVPGPILTLRQWLPNPTFPLRRNDFLRFDQISQRARPLRTTPACVVFSPLPPCLTPALVPRLSTSVLHTSLSPLATSQSAHGRN